MDECDNSMIIQKKQSPGPSKSGGLLLSFTFSESDVLILTLRRHRITSLG
jgi:hypothetical protein